MQQARCEIYLLRPSQESPSPSLSIALLRMLRHFRNSPRCPGPHIAVEFPESVAVVVFDDVRRSHVASDVLVRADIVAVGIELRLAIDDLVQPEVTAAALDLVGVSVDEGEAMPTGTLSGRRDVAYSVFVLAWCAAHVVSVNPC